MKNKTITLLISATIVFIGSGYFIFAKINEERLAEKALDFSSQNNLSPKVDSQGGTSFTVVLSFLDTEEPVKFKIEIDTHFGSLDFNLMEISFLEDDAGNIYQPLNWQGSPPGGHHLAGTLSFAGINKEAKIIQLIIQDGYLRIFEWDL